MRITMSLLALTIAVVGGTPASAPALPLDTSNVQLCDTSWPAPDDLVERADAAMLPTYGVEPTAYRAEARLSIVVAGVPRPVAGGIGFDPDGDRIAALHTDACDGVLRVTASERLNVHLWQLFEEWGVRLTQHCLGETCDAEGVRIVLDGDEIDMCPGAIPIEDGVRIHLSVD